VTEASTRAATGPATATARGGWIEAGLYVVCIALLSLAYAYGASIGAHAIVFVLYSLLISASALLIYTGLGRNAVAIMLHPASWVIGLGNIGVEAGYALLLSYVPPADGSLMIRFSIPLTLIIGALVFGRRPKPLVWVGAGIVGVVVGYLLAGVAPAIRLPVLACAVACAVSVVIRAFASEFHRWNRAAANITDKMQVTGLVTLVTAFASLVTVGALMAAVKAGLLPATPLLPTPAALVHAPTILLSLFVGGALFTAMTYLSFSSVLKIRSENFIATSAFMPLATLAVQTLAVAVGLITLPPFNWALLPAILAAIAGVLVMIWGGRKG
jgi:hypothetical protein